MSRRSPLGSSPAASSKPRLIASIQKEAPGRPPSESGLAAAGTPGRYFERVHAFSAILHGHGVSLILVPVFARPTKDRRWKRARAEVYSDATGSTVVVANSLVMGAILETPTPGRHRNCDHTRPRRGRTGLGA